MAKFWTDYPFTELGDVEHQEAPIRRCELVSYDYDKYVVVKVDGIEASIKAGYVYSQQGRCGDVPPISCRVLGILPQTV